MSEGIPPLSLPIGWIQVTDAQSGRVYFANPSSGETRWDPPPTSITSTPLHPPSRRMAVQDALSLVETIRNQSGDDIEIELRSLSAGQIADLVHLQRDRMRAESVSGPSPFYSPMDPLKFQATEQRQPAEHGRLVTRLHSLLEQLSHVQ
mmetsp:Transcript_38380/g.79799  ORF Transcript_38380/g.79799 Transcript_38380/m.79799 type:complete len:149 (+) Transcript_38380:170-616(+)